MNEHKREARDSQVKALLGVGTLAGSCIFVYGLDLIYHPLAYIVGGLILAAACFFGSYDRMRRSSR